VEADDDEFAPVKFEPSKDYQVREALSYLKSFGVFRRLVERESQQGEGGRLTASAADALNQGKAVPVEKTGKQ
jgi:hypothetical protein